MKKSEQINAKLKEIGIYLFRQLKKRYPSFRSSKLEKLESELAVLEQEPDEPVKEAQGAKTAEEIDLMQYVTNLLYAATNEGPTMGNIKFDEWVDQQINGLKAYYDQFQPETEREELRKELKAFNDFMCGNQYDGRIPMIDTCIDEYLSQRDKNIESQRAAAEEDYRKYGKAT